METKTYLTQPTSVNDPIIACIADKMRQAGRTELVHYAGACYRDTVAWHVCLGWLLTPKCSESALKTLALCATGYLP